MLSSFTKIGLEIEMFETEHCRSCCRQDWCNPETIVPITILVNIIFVQITLAFQELEIMVADIRIKI